jgi:hypothetical protein
MAIRWRAALRQNVILKADIAMNWTTTARHWCLGTMLVGLVAACVHTPPEPVFADSLQSASATVESADSVTRLIALRTPQGERLWITAGPEVRNFAQIRAGDIVTVNYYKAIAAQVKPKGTASTTQQDTIAAYTAKPGARPAAAIGRTIVETVRVQSVDTVANTVTFERQDGSVHTATVISPDGQTFMKGLRSGDDVDVAYTEAIAVAVVPSH